jgi:hypothetical protein
VFFKNTADNHKNDLKDEFNEMNAEAEKVRTELRTLMSSGSTEKLHKKLRTIDQMIIYKICVNDTELKAIFETENSTHENTWIKVLQRQKYPGYKIISIDGDDKVPIISQYLGAYLLNQSRLLENKSPILSSVYLDKACEYGIFNALKKRIAQNQEKIVNHTATRENLDTFFKDIDRISNLYWGIGCLHSARVLLNTGNLIVNQNEFGSLSEARVYHELAAQKFLWAKELSTYSSLIQNKHAIASICGEAGLAKFGFESWQSADADIFKYVDNSLTPHADMRTLIQSSVYDHVKTQRSPRA